MPGPDRRRSGAGGMLLRGGHATGLEVPDEPIIGANEGRIAADVLLRRWIGKAEGAPRTLCFGLAWQT
jgi:hypothetical protein